MVIKEDTADRGRKMTAEAREYAMGKDADGMVAHYTPMESQVLLRELISAGVVSLGHILQARAVVREKIAALEAQLRVLRAVGVDGPPVPDAETVRLTPDILHEANELVEREWEKGVRELGKEARKNVRKGAKQKKVGRKSKNELRYHYVGLLRHFRSDEREYYKKIAAEEGYAVAINAMKEDWGRDG